MDPLLAELELEQGDLELRFHDGRSTKVRSHQLALASSVLQNLMEDMGEEDYIATCKRKQAGGEPAAGSLTSLKVRPCCWYRC